MPFEPGITTFKVNEPIKIQNVSSPGFDKFTLYSIQGDSKIVINDDFEVGESFSYSYIDQGLRTIVLEGIKNVGGVSYTEQKSITFSVGYPVKEKLNPKKRPDQSSSYTPIYVQRGVTFELEIDQEISGSEPKTYIWNYGGGSTLTVPNDNPQVLTFSTTGFKNIGFTVTNPFGGSTSNVSIICVDTPVIGISASPKFGIVRTGEGLTLTAKLIEQNQHSWNDISYSWTVNGVTYNGQTIFARFDQGSTVGITFQYSSRILSGLSGNTFGLYNVLEVPGIYDIFVSGTTGNDSWSGKYSGISGVEGPLKTLAKAAEIARSYTGPLDININIGGGVYAYTEQSFYLTGGDSGINRIITYTPQVGDRVVISGGYTLSPSLFTLVTAGNPAIYNRLSENAQGNVYEANLSAMGISFGLTLPLEWNGRAVQNKYLPSIPDLFFNDIKMTVARWPNKSGYTSEIYRGFEYGASAKIDSVIRSGSSSQNPPLGATSGIFTYSAAVAGVINRWKVTGPSSFDGIWLHGFWKWDWVDEVYKVKSINKVTRQIEVHSESGAYGIAKNIPCPPPGSPSVYANPTDRRWFAFNLLEELDLPGEYYLDRFNQKLYFWPPSAIGATSNVVLSSIRLAGDNSWIPGTPQYADSVLQQQSHLNTLSVNASVFKFYGLKNVVIDGLEFHHMSGSGIEMTQCENVSIKNCKIYSPRKHGVVIVGGKDNIVDTCEIYYAGLNGVILSGGDRQNLIPANNSVENCKIIGFGTNSSNYAKGIQLTGVGNIIRKNIIANSGSKAIQLSGNDHIIEYNNFSNLISDQDDSGGIYIANNISDRNTTIRYNFFNNVKSQLPGGPGYDSSLPAGGCPTPPTKTQLTSAIYIDEYNCGVNILSNVFYACGSTFSSGGGAVFITHGLDHVIDNNIIIDSKTGVGHWFSKRSDWNTNAKAFKSGIDNIGLYGLQQIINVDDEPWYEEGSPSTTSGPSVLFGGRNYNPYSFFASGYGVEGTWRSTPGLLNKVNVTGITWTNRYPEIAGPFGMLRYDPDQYLMTFSNQYQLKNYVKNNVFVNVNKNTEILRSNDTESSFVVGNYLNYNNYDIFVDRNSFNFKLTPAGLTLIKQSIPNFQDIPFEQIPVL